MIDTLVLLAFLPAGLALNLTPGPDMVLCFGQGLRSGPRAAIAASAGISTGALVHAGVAGIGLSALILAAPVAFDVIKWIGVGYLLWMAIGAFRSGIETPEASIAIRPSRAFRDGFLVNISNPKVILFVMAFIPQFVDPTGAVLAQFMIFGVILGIGGFIVNGAVGVFAGSIGRYMTGHPSFGRIIGYVTGTVFAGLALRLAFVEAK